MTNFSFSRLLQDPQKNIDFVDAYHAVFLKSTGEKIIYSFDQDFDKIEWIERREPA